MSWRRVLTDERERVRLGDVLRDGELQHVQRQEHRQPDRHLGAVVARQQEREDRHEAQHLRTGGTVETVTVSNSGWQMAQVCVRVSVCVAVCVNQGLSQ